MDNPWGNAWSTPDAPASVPENDPWQPPASIKLDAAPVVPTWEPPAWPEDDPMQAAAIWNSGKEPSEPSELSEPSEPEDEPVDDEPVAEDEPEPVPAPERESSPTGIATPALPLSPPLPLDEEGFARQSRSPSPDAFGSFESADVDDSVPVDNAWAAARPVQAETPAARSLWSADEWKQDVEEGQDEWAAASARQRLEDERERRFPREIVNAALEQWDELSADLWPPQEDEEKKDADARLESVPGLPELIASLVPDYHLQPVPQLVKTATFKSMQTSLRMTKSYAMVQASPLSQFYSSKGNSAWESSVKAKEVVKDDWPWEKPQEAVATPVATPATDKPARGGILSLWRGRPTSMPPPPKDAAAAAAAASSRTASPAPRASMDKPRPSMDSARSVASKETSKPSTASSPVVSTPPVHAYELSSPTNDTPTDAAPSAMARLFGRFSRNNAKPATQALADSTSDGSISMSASDLSFLSDVVPSTSGSRLLPDDDILGGLGAPSPSILPSRLPAPLAPPPKAPPLLQAAVGKKGWDFEDDDEFSATQESLATGAALDALLGGGSTNFQQGYAPISSRKTQRPERAPTPPRIPTHKAILPSSLLAAERQSVSIPPPLDIRPLPAPPPRSDTPSRRPLPPPSPLFGGDEFDDFMSSPAIPTPPSQFPVNFASPSAAPLVASPPTSTAAADDFGDFGDFISPPTSPPLPAIPPVQAARPVPQRSAPTPVAQPQWRPPEPPRTSARTPLAVMSRSGTLSGTAAPLLAPPPGSSRTPTVVMTRSSTPRTSTGTPPPLLAPPPGSSRLAPKQNLPDQQAEDLLFDTQPTSPSSTVGTGSQQQSPIASPIRPESRSSLPPAPRTSSPSLFDDLARPLSRNSLPGGNNMFSSVPAVSSPLAPLKMTMSPPPGTISPPPLAMNGNAFSFFDAAPAPVAKTTSPPLASPPNGANGSATFSMPMPMLQPAKPASGQQGKLSAADLSFFDSL